MKEALSWQILFLILVSSLMREGSAQASPKNPDRQARSLVMERYASPRSRGMAGTGLSHVSDWNAVYLNPALLGDPFGPRVSSNLRSLTFPSLSGDVSEDAIGVMDKLGKVTTGSDGFAPVFKTFDGSRGFHLRQEAFPNLVLGRFLFGFHQSILTDAQSYRLSEPKESIVGRGDDGTAVTYETEAVVHARAESYTVVGFSVPAGKRASLGVMGRYGVRAQADGTAEVGIGTEESSLGRASDEPAVGHGFNADVGFIYEFWEKGGGRFSLVGRNLGEGQFLGVEDNAVVIADPMELDVGVALAPRFRRRPYSPAFSIEAHELLRGDVDIVNKFRIGAEVGFAKLYSKSHFALRLGTDLHGFSYGLSLDIFLFRIDLAAQSYRVHLPDRKARNEQRYLFRTSWDLQN